MIVFRIGVVTFTINLFFNTSVLCYKPNPFQLYTLRPIRLGVSSMAPLSKNGNLLLGYFKNKQGVLIRTYASRVNNPKGHVILVHGIRSHFRAEFCSYNVDWYMKYVTEYVNSTAKIVGNRELDGIFPSFTKSYNGQSLTYKDSLHGKNAFDLTPRFLYEGSFVQALNNLNYSVYGLDLQSHGLSGGVCDQRCYVEKFDDFVYDVIQFVSIVKRGKFDDPGETWNADVVFRDERSDDNKYHLGGLSMGGNIVLKSQILFNLNIEKPTKFVDGIISMGGMLNIDHHYSGIKFLLMPILRLYSLIAPKHTIILENTDGYADGMIPCMRYNDPIFFKKRLPSRMVLIVYDATKDLRTKMDYYPKDLPTLFIHSKDDQMCSVEGPREYIDTYFKDSDLTKLFELDGRTHVITSPLYTSSISSIIEEWLNPLDITIPKTIYADL